MGVLLYISCIFSEHFFLRTPLDGCLGLIFTILYERLYSFFSTIHLQWIKKISLSKRAVYTPSRRYMCVDLFCIPCLTFSLNVHLIHFLTILLVFRLVCFAKHKCVLELILTTMKFQPFFIFRRHLDFEVTIAAAVLIVLVFYWHSTKTIETVHAQVICSFMNCIHRLKRL